MEAITVRDLMTAQPVVLPPSATLAQAAKAMRDANIGAVLIGTDGNLTGIVTDRDVVIRAIAEGKDPRKTTVEQVSSKEVTALSADDPIDRAVQVMRDKAVRRLPVTDGHGTPVGILSIGDLAIKLDEKSALGQISAAQANR